MLLTKPRAPACTLHATAGSPSCVTFPHCSGGQTAGKKVSSFPCKEEDVDLCRWWEDGRVGSLRKGFMIICTSRLNTCSWDLASLKIWDSGRIQGKCSVQKQELKSVLTSPSFNLKKPKPTCWGADEHPSVHPFPSAFPRGWGGHTHRVMSRGMSLPWVAVSPHAWPSLCHAQWTCAGTACWGCVGHMGGCSGDCTQTPGSRRLCGSARSGGLMKPLRDVLGIPECSIWPR